MCCLCRCVFCMCISESAGNACVMRLHVWWQVSAEDVSLGKVAKYMLEHLKCPLVLVRPFQPISSPRTC